MALEAGSQLGQYEILSSLGAGGMGEVYRAKDTKLGREVAIKLLLEEVATDPERLARFKREARVLASLNHPNIATLHGFESQGDTRFLVMELVDGETLADRITRGPIPIDEALPLFTEIAAGLEVAHNDGVIHRDLKPANIKLDERGSVKILDFGLAKAMALDSDPSADASASLSPTLTLAATQRGEILGTAAYMSPEQASGKAVDSRTDIWAFGVCLFEALTGARPFAAEDAANTLAAVLRDEVDFSRLPADGSPSLVRLIRRCLVRKREQRLQHIGDARIELEAVAAGEESIAANIPVPVTTKAWGWLALTHLVAVAAAVWIYGALAGDPQSTAPPLAKYRVESRAGTIISVFQGLPVLELSRDGRWLASSPLSSFFDDDSERVGIHVKMRDRLEETGLEGTSGTSFLLASPDGDEIVYFNQGGLRAMPVQGGIPREVGYSNVEPPLGADWLGDGSLVLAHSPAGERPRLVRMSSLDDVLFTPQSGPAASQAWPRVLPGGTHVLYVERESDTAPWQVMVGSLATGSTHTLTEGRYARFASSGHVVFARDDVLYAMAVGTGDWRPAGDPVPMVEGVVSHDRTGAAQYALADDGTLSYLPEDQLTVENQILVWVDRDGRETPIGEPATSYGHPRLSADGTRLIAARIQGEPAADIVLYDLARGLEEQLTHSPSGPSWYPLWLRGRSDVAFMDTTADGSQLFVRETTGARRVTAVIDSPAARGGGPSPLLDSAPSGDALLYAFDGDLFLLSLDGDEPRALLETPGIGEYGGSISPDGRWIAFQTDREGRWEVEVRPYPDLERDRWRISTAGGQLPAWAPDGSEIYFWQGDTFMAARVQTGADFEVSPPTALFSGPGFRKGNPGLGRTYDPAPDGRFVMVKQDIEETFSLVVVQNWHEELERLAPTS